MFKIAPYSHGSKSANVLKEALGALFLKKVGSDYKFAKGDVVINWGAPYGPSGMPSLNEDNNIVRDKVKFFKTVYAAGLKEFIPAFSTTKQGAFGMNFPVFCRTEVDGHDGSGIVIAHKTADLVAAKLYTSYIKQTQEYRVHVGKIKGKAVIIHVQRKAKLNASTDKETMIRTGSHGYILAHNNFTAPECVFEAAKKVFMACNLDFGGCDVVYNEETKRAYVLEINTAPELSGPSVAKYAEFFQGFQGVEDGAGEAVAAGGGAKSLANSEVAAAVGDVLATKKPEPVVSATAGAKEIGLGVLVGSSVGKSLLGSSSGAAGKAASVSGGDIAGLMKQLELSVEAKIQAAKKAAFDEGFATGKGSVKSMSVTELQEVKNKAYTEGKAHGSAEFKAKMKELFA